MATEAVPWLLQLMPSVDDSEVKLLPARVIRIQRGATWVELDVKLTADRVPVVMHDASLKRTTGLDRLVAETQAADLPGSVPTFEQAIACFGELGLGAGFGGEQQ